MTLLPITLTAAAAAAVLNIWLGARVINARGPLKISVGDGGSEAVLRRMRAQANFVENAPFFLILLGAIELADGHKLILWIVAVAFILARIAHALGMDAGSPRLLRVFGMTTTALTIVGLAGYAVAMASA
jgi:uncharacterized membrane protein YecN with MAPEG domain